MECKSYLDFSKICRICLSENMNMEMINASIAEMLITCCDISIHEMDNLPKNICFNCIQSAQNCFSFREQCKRSENFLKEIIKYNEEQTYLLISCNNKNGKFITSIGVQVFRIAF